MKKFSLRVKAPEHFVYLDVQNINICSVTNFLNVIVGGSDKGQTINSVVEDNQTFTLCTVEAKVCWGKRDRTELRCNNFGGLMV